MKFNNENAKEQIAYVAPKSRLIYVKIEGMICTSDFNTTWHTENYGVDQDEDV